MPAAGPGGGARRHGATWGAAPAGGGPPRRRRGGPRTTTPPGGGAGGPGGGRALDAPARLPRQPRRTTVRCWPPCRLVGEPRFIYGAGGGGGGGVSGAAGRGGWRDGGPGRGGAGLAGRGRGNKGRGGEGRYLPAQRRAGQSQRRGQVNLWGGRQGSSAQVHQPRAAPRCLPAGGALAAAPAANPGQLPPCLLSRNAATGCLGPSAANTASSEQSVLARQHQVCWSQAGPAASVRAPSQRCHCVIHAHGACAENAHASRNRTCGKRHIPTQDPSSPTSPT